MYIRRTEQRQALAATDDLYDCLYRRGASDLPAPLTRDLIAKAFLFALGEV